MDLFSVLVPWTVAVEFGSDSDPPASFPLPPGTGWIELQTTFGPEGLSRAPCSMPARFPDVFDAVNVFRGDWRYSCHDRAST